MPDYEGTTTVSAPQNALFDYLSDVSHVPEYFARITRTERTGPEEVHTEAKLPDGQSVQGDAWFRVDDAAQRISWGSEGENDYHGSLDVDSVAAGSRVVVKIHSPHVDDGQVQQGVDQTLAIIKEKVEAQGVAQP